VKLARPDVFHPRIVLAGGGAPDADDAGLVAALRARGLHARWLAWDDPQTANVDLVILRETAGYEQRLDEFLAWTRRVPNLLNSPAVVAWNADKGYLDDLGRAGVPLSGSSVAATSLVFLGGQQSHALLGEPDFELWGIGYAALDAAAHRLGVEASEFLYARAEVTGGPQDPALLSLDLVAPSLGWKQLDATAQGLQQREFALSVESALERLGLGPFSHRRP
jgi:hypothetical protein